MFYMFYIFLDTVRIFIILFVIVTFSHRLCILSMASSFH